MNLNLSSSAANMLFRMLVRPDTLEPCKPYAAPDTITAVQVVELRKWVLEEVAKKSATNKETGKDRYEVGPYQGSLIPSYTARLISICEHYKPAGLMVHNVDAFMELYEALHGRKLELVSTADMKDKQDLPPTPNPG